MSVRWRAAAGALHSHAQPGQSYAVTVDPVSRLPRVVPPMMPGQQLAVSLVAPQATGKTTFALALCERVGAVRVSGDAVKTELWGDVMVANRNDSDRQKRHDQAYEIVYRQAEQALRDGRHLVRDHIHDTARARERARALADAYGTYYVLVWLHVATEVAVARYLDRCEADPARRDIVRGDRDRAAESIGRVEAKLVVEPPPPPRCVRLDALRPTDELVAELLNTIGYRTVDAAA